MKAFNDSRWLINHDGAREQKKKDKIMFLGMLAFLIGIAIGLVK